MSSCTYQGPKAYALADWRRQINDLYADIRRLKNPREAWLHWHSTRSTLFRNHPLSPLDETTRAHFHTIDVFDYDPALRFSVDLIAETGPVIDVDLADDGIVSYRRTARTKGLVSSLGSELDVYWINGYGGGLFLPFRDHTSQTVTYGGGRYLIDAIKGADLGLDKSGRLILDFNFAYNPSCALNETYVCPLAPAENVLPTAILAGERTITL